MKGFFVITSDWLISVKERQR